ncbi:MAG: sulfurtransferase-like selenium metabolism protein YedF [Thermodesulfovibrio sp.]|nr:sulfurtransferase-like selenium metabolism protein YedF [Thermodesulfovibrio sp.]MDW7998648.1 sulfurtransferase-like selenium metabolism protein YedF [Thermodesulfovibrio sp.]
MEIDARGLECPKPIILAESALSQINEGIIIVIVDNEASLENLKKYARKFGYFYEVIKQENYWKIKIVKGFSCQISNMAEKDTEKDLILIITSDIIGKDESLGRILMKAFFETMLLNRQLPKIIFLMNTAVKLSTIDEEFVSILKKIEQLGTEIFTCGTCLKYYNLEDSLKVGYRGTTNNYIEGIFDFKKTIWIG